MSEKEIQTIRRSFGSYSLLVDIRIGESARVIHVLNPIESLLKLSLPQEY